MNNIEFMQTGGFPLELDILNYMQDDYSNFNDIGHIIGDKAIVKGCITTGSTVSDGTIFYNGEFLKFVGGIEQSTFLIRETAETKEFQNGDVKIIFKNRFAEFGTGIDAIDWADFKRPLDLLSISERLNSLDKKTAVFQTGGAMVFWNKPVSDIPEGWQEVTDWRGRMPVGLDTLQSEFDTIGYQGGSKTETLSENQLPAHNHTGNAVSAGNHSHTLFFSEYATGSDGGPGYDGGNNKYQPNINKTTSTGGGHSHTLNINNAGGGHSHNNLPPYRTVLFIEFIA